MVLIWVLCMLLSWPLLGLLAWAMGSYGHRIGLPELKTLGIGDRYRYMKSGWIAFIELGICLLIVFGSRSKKN